LATRVEPGGPHVEQSDEGDRAEVAALGPLGPAADAQDDGEQEQHADRPPEEQQPQDRLVGGRCRRA
jgi:hypothetical protein